MALYKFYFKKYINKLFLNSLGYLYKIQNTRCALFNLRNVQKNPHYTEHLLDQSTVNGCHFRTVRKQSPSANLLVLLIESFPTHLIN